MPCSWQSARMARRFATHSALSVEFSVGCAPGHATPKRMKFLPLALSAATSAALNVWHVPEELHGVVPSTRGSQGGPFTTTASPLSTAGFPVVMLIQSLPITLTDLGTGGADDATAISTQSATNPDSIVSHRGDKPLSKRLFGVFVRFLSSSVPVCAYWVILWDSMDYSLTLCCNVCSQYVQFDCVFCSWKCSLRVIKIPIPLLT